MNIKSINSYFVYDNNTELYDIFTPVFIYRTDLPMKEYEVTEYTEMRIDIIFKEMYNLSDSDVRLYVENIDIILYLNNIDNYLNIVKGMILKYPAKIEDFYKFRYERSNLEEDILSKMEKLLVPNKSTKTDSNRNVYIENNYSLPPVILETPKPPVIMENGKFLIGGL